MAWKVPDAAVAAGGGIIGSALSYKDAQEARKWQERMARNAVQYRVEDLRKAGINPILAAGAGLGGGLSVPGTAVANPGDFGGSAYSTARAQTAQRKVAEAQGRYWGAEADIKEAERDHIFGEGQQPWKAGLDTRNKPQGPATLEWLLNRGRDLWDNLTNTSRDSRTPSEKVLEGVTEPPNSARQEPRTIPLTTSVYPVDDRKNWEAQSDLVRAEAIRLWRKGHIPGEPVDQFLEQAKENVNPRRGRPRPRSR